MSTISELVAPSLSADERESARVAIYRFFATRGRSPTLTTIMRASSLSAPQARRALLDLHQSRDLVLDPGVKRAWEAGETGESGHEGPNGDGEEESLVVLAHPFSSVNLGFSVMGRNNVYWGGCAWDAFALPSLVPSESPCLIATRCPGCRNPIAVDVSSDYPPLAGPEAPVEATAARMEGPGPVAHFATPMKDAWEDVVKTCSMQNLFCTEGCVERWCKQEGRAKGYVMDVDTLWHFARDWYTGRLERGYERREPAQAKEYFRKVGLRGSFWGLED
ncbi:putative transmembrane protein [Trichosporon asahii var. asahii CBS 2479]|uniref:Putative transmembrane protein n=1 Tax=Trichosporon asahii var. asahii (strain ATCC 90039 / CBS 2479 / JCM 2466 / KCTC 7840 / NBRC 103889/ NCYC 2677 / UAMH 7654) TaxID=1186058 RepID=J8TJC7_TRIAS|nr:putative transmembrane protein [Trichosporon asahii var. asahii CBS 2479]EJT53276.1 putative transmembrane protein [Trichosporon asahii var. asahii CBS 2479]